MLRVGHAKIEIVKVSNYIYNYNICLYLEMEYFANMVSKSTTLKKEMRVKFFLW